MTRWRVVPALALLTSAAACEIFTEPLGELEVRLTVGADSMVPGAPIPITIIAKNAGVFPIGFSGGGGCLFGYDLIYPDGTIPAGEERRCYWAGGTRIRLEPGDSVVEARSFAGVESPAGTYRLRPYVNADQEERRGPAVPVEVLPSARARLVHTHPALPTLDLVVGGRRTAAVVARGSPSPEGLTPTGVQTVEIRRTGWATPIASAPFEFVAGRRYTFAIRDVPAGPELWAITDPDTVVGPGHSRLRLVHLAAGAPAVTVQATAPDGADPLGATDPLRYGVAWPYVSSAPGWWRLLVTGPGGADTLIQWSLRIYGGQVRTLVLLDGDAGAIYGILLEP